MLCYVQCALGLKYTHFDYFADHYTAIGCVDDLINLSCPGNTTIILSNAIYGYYAFDCAIGCCPPSPSADCSGSVNASYPEDWAYLAYTCEGKNSCNYEYKGRNLDYCDATLIADYMQIF